MPEPRQRLVGAFAVPSALFGCPPALDTARERADYIAAMADAMGIDALDLAERDPDAQGLLLHDRLRLMGAL